MLLIASHNNCNEKIVIMSFSLALVSSEQWVCCVKKASILWKRQFEPVIYNLTWEDQFLWYSKCELITSVDQFGKFIIAIKKKIEVLGVSTQTMPISSPNYPIIKFNSTRDHLTEFLEKFLEKKSIFWLNQNFWCLNNSAASNFKTSLYLTVAKYKRRKKYFMSAGMD